MNKSNLFFEEKKEEKQSPTFFVPDSIQNSIKELSEVIQNFRNYLPAYETMQATNPLAYEAMVNVVMTLISLSQILLESNVLRTDEEVKQEKELNSD